MTQSIVPRSEPQWTLAELGDNSPFEVVSCLINAATTKTQPEHEQRRHQRHPFPHLVTLTPIADTNLTPVEKPIVVVGKHLSVGGFDFFHNAPLPYKRVIASFDELPWGTATHIILVGTWCRFLRPDWYDSGGRFSHVVRKFQL